MAFPPGFGVLTTDVELRVRSWNDWLQAATGLLEHDVQGRPLIDLVPPGRRDLIREVLDEVVGTGTPRVLAPAFHKYFLLCPPRTLSPHFREMQQSTTIAPLRDGEQIVGLIVTLEDVTARLDQDRALAGRVEAVGAEDWQTRRAAVGALRQSASSEEVAHLLETMERDHQNLNVLSSALQVLVAANRDVTSPLIELLSHASANLRMHAALGLGTMREPAAVPGLLRALDDEDANVQFHAIEALGQIGAPEATVALTRIARSGNFFLAFPAVDALARSDDADVAQALVALLDQESLRPAVIDALAVLGDEDAVVPLVRILNDDAMATAPVAAALARIERRYEEGFRAGAQIVDLVRRSATPEGVNSLAAALGERKAPLEPLVVVLGWMGSRALPALMTMLSEPTVRHALTEAVVAIGAAAVDPLTGLLEGTDRDARVLAASLLGRVGDRRAVPALMAALSSADDDLAAMAASALAGLGDPRALDVLLPLFEHPHTFVRQAAIAAVNSIGAEDTSARIRLLLGSDDPLVRECAVRVAGYFGFEACVPQILTAVTDPNEDVRRAAIEQLPVLDDARARAALLTALGTETAKNRASAAHALRAVEGPATTAALLSALADRDAWVRYFAAGSLGERGGAGAAEALLGVATADSATHVRIASVQSLGALAPSSLVPVATPLITDADDDLACAAARALAGAAGDVVEDILAEAARSPRLALRLAAFDALAARGTPRAVATLAWAARADESPSAATLAVEGVGRIAAGGGASARAAAVAALFSLAMERAQRPLAIAALSALPAEAVADVAHALSPSFAQEIRIVAVESLARMRHPRASAALASALLDDEATVRAAAVAAFGSLGSPAAARVIAAMRTSDPDPGVRRRAAAVCRRYGWGADATGA